MTTINSPLLLHRTKIGRRRMRPRGNPSTMASPTAIATAGPPQASFLNPLIQPYGYIRDRSRRLHWLQLRPE